MSGTDSYASAQDVAVDDAALAVMAEQYGDRVRKLPPVALVIAAFNEEGAVGPVVQNLPAEVSGLKTATIVVADGCADATAKEADAAGALVADVPVNRGQGAALRLGYRIAREGGAALHRDHGRRRPVQPGRDREADGADGGRPGRLRDRLPAARQRGDPRPDPAGRGAVLRGRDQPADRAEASATPRSACGPCGPR